MESFVERVLIVIKPDGTLNGAHMERVIMTLTTDGTAIMTPLPAELLDELTLSIILPDQGQLLAQLSSANNTIAVLQAQITEMQNAGN